MKLRQLIQSYKEPITHFSEKEHRKGRGFLHRGNLYIHHSDLDHEETAFITLLTSQKFYIALLIALVGLFLLIDWHATLVWIFGTLTVLYFIDLLFNLFLIVQNFRLSPEIKISERELESINEKTLPLYTIFCPLYKEWRVVEQFANAMEKLDYPKDKLQVMLILEEDDKETIEKVRTMKLPKHFESLVVPHSKPKTKPKAMNYALKFAKGEYLVIFDAEDVPEPDQLKKTYLTFKRLPKDVVCIQAKLNFYNAKQNVLTRAFTAEYSLWFDLVLTGLQSIEAPIPLGGTSNHFRTADIRTLKGWDAFNVTEDCDLGMRLFKRGYRTAIVDSTTFEEANSHFGNWYRQRSRWIKGYIQTYLVHMRRPKDFFRKNSRHHAGIFQLVIGGKILSMFVNPLMWLVTLSYFAFRTDLGPFIETFFPVAILYIGVFSFTLGNFLYLYYYMIGCAKRGYYDLIKYVFLVPFYWLMMSVAAWQAVYEIIVKPHYWAKTVHGLHLEGAHKTPSIVSEQKRASATHTDTQGDFGDFSKAFQETFREAEEARAKMKETRLRDFFAVFKDKVFSGGALFVLANIIANFLNFVFNAILGRDLALEDFGLLTLLNTLVYLLSIFSGAYGTVINQNTARLEARKKEVSALHFLKRSNRLALTITTALAFVWLINADSINTFFQTNNLALILLVSPIISIIFLSSGNRSFLQGDFQFKNAAIVVLVEAFSKLIFALVFLYTIPGNYVALSLPLSIIFGYLASIYFISKFTSSEAKGVPKGSTKYSFPLGFFSASLITGLSTAVFLSVDVILVKHYLSPEIAGQYSLLSLVGKMIFFFGSLLNFAIIPFASHDRSLGVNPSKRFNKILLGTFALVGISFLGLGVFGRVLVPLLLGAKSTLILPYLLSYGLSISFFTIANTLVTYHLAEKRYMFPILSLLTAILLGVGISLNHTSLASVVHLIFLVSLGRLAVIALLHIWRGKVQFILKDIGDLLDVFSPLPTLTPKKGGKRILVFNWRDTEHKHAGGAEVYIHELAKRWVKAGNAVLQFSGNDGHSIRNDVIDGVHIIRRGGFYFVFLWAFIYYMVKFRGKFDLIIDCHNGLPFFTPLYAKEPIFCFLYHVHQEVFKKYLSLPLYFIASNLESKIMPVVYKNKKFITISHSTLLDMQKWNLTGSGVDIVFPGVNLSHLVPGELHDNPLILYLGRLKAYKSVDVLIHAFALIVKKKPEARLVIAGEGEEAGSLKTLARTLGLEEKISFTGKVTEKEKILLLQKAWVFVNPSMMEGWGITTIEANACGAPVVASDVPGLRDSVQHLSTGYLVEHGNAKEFALKILSLIDDSDLRETMSSQSVEWSKQFSWDTMAKKSLTILT